MAAWYNRKGGVIKAPEKPPYAGYDGPPSGKVDKPADWPPPNNIYIGLEVAEERGSPLNKQVGGDHYKKLKIQPVEYNHANGLDFFQGSVVKYITRFRDKNGKADLEKAKHFIELLIELEYDNTTHHKG